MGENRGVSTPPAAPPATPAAARPRRTRTPVLDPAAAAAVDLARDAAREAADAAEHVGEHLGAVADDDRMVTHAFTCLAPAYRGWQWSVTLARASRSRQVTVSEVVLLPGHEALLAPPWTPFSDRVRPGDLGVGDLLPTPPDDPRLEPGYAATGDEEADRLALWELGLGRVRVLSAVGRDDAAMRWYDGERGPRSPLALAAPAHCRSCGFLLPLAGALRQLFGVCTNEHAPDDGAVVSLDHGCGAHSEAVPDTGPVPLAGPVVDELGYDLV